MTPVERRSEQDPSAAQTSYVSEALKSPKILKSGLEVILNTLQQRKTHIGLAIASTTIIIGYWAYFKYREWKFRKSIDRDD